MNFYELFVLILTFLGNIPKEIKTVDNLNLTSYMGHWNQVYTNRITQFAMQKSFQNDSSCLSTDYKLMDKPFDDKLIMSFNQKDNTISGIGQQLENPGEYIVNFINEDFFMNYFILENGPIENNKYQYSIITDYYGVTLFVLMRDLGDFLLFEKDISNVLQQYNFTDYYREPILVNNQNC